MVARMTKSLVLVLAAAVMAACGGASDESAEPASGEGPSAQEAPGTSDRAPRERSAPVGELRASFLDVGQGDATLLEGPDATMLIDAGRHDRDDVVPALEALGVENIDVIAITHAHADHIGQLPEVLAAFEVSEVWMSGTPHTTLTFERALEALEASDAAYEEPRAGDETEVGSLWVEVIHPEVLSGDLHADSLAMRVSFGNLTLLFTGDAEAPHEAEMVARDERLLDSDVYQVGHHGSSTSTSPLFLAAIDPEVAIYSAAAGNQYGHPHDEVIALLESAGVAIYGTDIHGTVTVESDGRDYEVSTQSSGEVASDASAGTGESNPQPPQAADSVPDTEGCVDINRAGPTELERIVHIGPERAQQIVSLRPFSSLDDLSRVSGLAEARVADIKAEGVACV